MGNESTIIWRRLDMPGHESATVFFDEGKWFLDGASVFLYEGKPCRLDYTIECDEDWNTLVASVIGWVGEEAIDLEIEVDEDLRWFVNEEEITEVAGCVDLDLNFSPVTNSLPISRFDLEVGESADVKAAWLRFPSFEFETLEQKYTRISENVYRYESAGGDFVREIEVNDAGLVTNYPDYFEIEK